MELSTKALNIKPSSTLVITAKAKQMKEEGIDVVAFSAGEPDFDTPAHIKDAAINAINTGFTKYTPEAGTIELRRAISDKLKDENNLNYDYTQIIVSNGGKHALTNVFWAILNKDDEVLIPSPYWLSYPHMVRLADGIPVIVNTKYENNYKITIEELQSSLTEHTKAIIINSPNNPTGMIYSRGELEVIADFAVKNNLFVISDEIYEKLIYDGKKHISIASLNEDIFQKTIVVNGLSKSYSMTGWRVGYAAAPPEIARLMYNIQGHSTSNINSIAQKAALAAITGSQQCVEDMRIQFEKRRDYILKRIEEIPFITAIRPEGAFYVFVDISKLLDKTIDGKKITPAADFTDVLLDIEKTVVVECGDFGYNNCIRLSYAIPMESIMEGMNRIKNFIINNY